MSTHAVPALLAFEEGGDSEAPLNRDDARFPRNLDSLERSG
jgi:hypothetical protein